MQHGRAWVGGCAYFVLSTRTCTLRSLKPPTCVSRGRYKSRALQTTAAELESVIRGGRSMEAYDCLFQKGEFTAALKAEWDVYWKLPATLPTPNFKIFNWWEGMSQTLPPVYVVAPCAQHLCVATGGDRAGVPHRTAPTLARGQAALGLARGTWMFRPSLIPYPKPKHNISQKCWAADSPTLRLLK